MTTANTTPELITRVTIDDNEVCIIRCNSRDRQWGGQWTFCSSSRSGEIVGVGDIIAERTTLKQARLNRAIPSVYQSDPSWKSQGLYYHGMRIVGFAEFRPRSRVTRCTCDYDIPEEQCSCGGRTRAIAETGDRHPRRDIYHEYELPDGPPCWHIAGEGEIGQPEYVAIPASIYDGEGD